ncbi:MAG: efflux RND transporter periplasmic adaptor subunit [Deltaproteobacteria bacterium]|nr:efflux RND transporter periplasmic adaptor subunit [Deltaproteobacteria bacterium]
MQKRKPLFLLALITLALAASLLPAARAAAQGPQAPPAVVVLAPVEAGSIQPLTPWVGTVRFAHVADVAAEIDGLVLRVGFEEGRQVKKGEVLAEVDTELRQQSLAALRAQQGQVQVELDLARLDFSRFAELRETEAIARQTYDEYRYRMLGLEKKLAATAAESERLTMEINKAQVLAPFDGVVLQRNIEPGEWLDRGGVVGVLADFRQVDAVINGSAAVIQHLDQGQEVVAEIAGQSFTGRLEAIIPLGDSATRTFPIKVRLPASPLLMEGMEARLWLPAGERREGLLVPRDAVVPVMGRDSVFTEVDGAARLLPVTLLGYEGDRAGVETDGLKPGMRIVVKGHERLRDGQPLQMKK